MPPQSSTPLYADFASDRLVIGAGVAIFHLASERVVVCYHTREKHWFLPKGRKSANEPVERTAEREGFEETGYRNRLLPLPVKHKQPDPEEGHQFYVTEPLWTQLLPASARTQYMLFWYAAETVPPEIERAYADARSAPAESAVKSIYQPPPSFPTEITLQQRVSEDVLDGETGEVQIYEPVRHEGTGVDEDELCYASYLLPIVEARAKLKGSVMEDVVRRAWEAIQFRMELEQRNE